MSIKVSNLLETVLWVHFISSIQLFHLCIQSYEGAFGQGPGHEAHGGSTFCALATLVLMDRVEDVLDGRKIRRLQRWCIMKQVSGFQGRPNKDPDTCYSFWVGATLALLNAFHTVNAQENLEFVKSTEDSSVGGFSKYPDSFPGEFIQITISFSWHDIIVFPSFLSRFLYLLDVLHTFLGLSGLSLHEEVCLGLKPVEPTLNISKTALAAFRQLCWTLSKSHSSVTWADNYRPA